MPHETAEEDELNFSDEESVIVQSQSQTQSTGQSQERFVCFIGSHSYHSFSEGST